jgi:uncharacterized protein YecT (DUF1311 family)
LRPAGRSLTARQNVFLSADTSVSQYSLGNMTMRATLVFVLLMQTARLGAEQCTDQPECWPEGSAMHTGLLRRAAEERLRTDLQQAHKKLVALISTKASRNGVEYFDDQRLVEAIERQQKSWEQFKDAECELIGSLSTAASTWQSAKSVECEVNLTSQRLKRMRHAVGCVRKIAPEQRKVEQLTCLYQLAPLAVPLPQ